MVTEEMSLEALRQDIADGERRILDCEWHIVRLRGEGADTTVAAKQLDAMKQFQERRRERLTTEEARLKKLP